MHIRDLASMYEMTAKVCRLIDQNNGKVPAGFRLEWIDQGIADPEESDWQEASADGNDPEPGYFYRLVPIPQVKWSPHTPESFMALVVEGYEFLRGCSNSQDWGRLARGDKTGAMFHGHGFLTWNQLMDFEIAKSPLGPWEKCAFKS